MTAIPLLFLAAFPSGVKSMPRCLAIAFDTGVISISPTPRLLAESFTAKQVTQKKLTHYIEYTRQVSFDIKFTRQGFENAC